MSKHLALLRKMARRATVTVSEKIPLRVYDPDARDLVDVSEDCTYYVQFRDVGGAAKDAILSAGMQETIEREETHRGRGVMTTKEKVRRQNRMQPCIEAIVENSMVADACFPVLNAGGTFQGWRWKQDNEENIEFLLDERTPFELLMWFVQEAYEFLTGPEEVVEELGESSSATPLGETTPTS